MRDYLHEVVRNFRDDMAVRVRMGEIAPTGYGLWYMGIEEGDFDSAYYLPIPLNYIAASIRWAYWHLVRCAPARWCVRYERGLLAENARLRARVAELEGVYPDA